MDTAQQDGGAFQIRRESLLALVSEMIGANIGREDPEHPLPPGPWDPVVRLALERSRLLEISWRLGQGVAWRRVLGPRPEPWLIALKSIIARYPEALDAIDGDQLAGSEDALNSQPLRAAFLISVAQTVASRAELIQEVIDATRRDGEQGSANTSTYLVRFADDWCGTGFGPKYPIPGPRPNWFPTQLEGIDLLVLAAQLEQSAKETFSQELGAGLVTASTKLAQAGLEKRG